MIKMDDAQLDEIAAEVKRIKEYFDTEIGKLLAILGGASTEEPCPYQVCKNCGDDATVDACTMHLTCYCTELAK